MFAGEVILVLVVILFCVLVAVAFFRILSVFLILGLFGATLRKLVLRV